MNPYVVSGLKHVLVVWPYSENTSKHHDLEIVPERIPAQDLPELIAIGPQKHETQDEGPAESSVVCSLDSGVLVIGVLNMDNIKERANHLGYEKHRNKRGSKPCSRLRICSTI